MTKSKKGENSNSHARHPKSSLLFSPKGKGERRVNQISVSSPTSFLNSPFLPSLPLKISGKREGSTSILLDSLITRNKFPNQYKGIQLKVSGRLRGAMRARRMQLNFGGISCQTVNSSLQSSKKQILTKWGTLGSTVFVSH